jgi:putative endonuclease
MSTDSRQRLGQLGERLAAEHYERLGYQVVARRHRTRHGGLDLVVADVSTLVFCEVKARRLGGRPWDKMTPEKCMQVRRMALAWLAAETDRPYRSRLRFDAVGVVLDEQDALVRLDHLEDAF